MKASKIHGNERRRGALVALALGVVLSACAGENLFSVAASTGESGPEVEITTPTEGLTRAVGDSVLVEANVNAQAGGSSVSYEGTYEADGEDAYTPETASLNGLVTVTLSNYLRAEPTQEPGTAVIVVAVTDLAGETSADTVTVTITN